MRRWGRLGNMFFLSRMGIGFHPYSLHSGLGAWFRGLTLGYGIFLFYFVFGPRLIDLLVGYHGQGIGMDIKKDTN